MPLDPVKRAAAAKRNYYKHRERKKKIKLAYYYKNKAKVCAQATKWRKRNRLVIKVARTLGITLAEARQRL